MADVVAVVERAAPRVDLVTQVPKPYALLDSGESRVRRRRMVPPIDLRAAIVRSPVMRRGVVRRGVVFLTAVGFPRVSTSVEWVSVLVDPQLQSFLCA